jgi:hypothetical protein
VGRGAVGAWFPKHGGDYAFRAVRGEQAIVTGEEESISTQQTTVSTVDSQVSTLNRPVNI